MENELKHFSNQITVTKAKDLPEGQFEAIISTETLDRHGEHVSISGMEIPKGQVFKMYYNHLTWGEALPIGKWLRVWKSKGVLMGLGEIDLDDEFALKVYKKLKSGYLDSMSVGFSGREYDTNTNTWTKSVFREASVVAEPANTEAQVTRKSLGFTEEEFEASLKVRLKADHNDPECVESAETNQEETVVEEGSDNDAEIRTAIEEMKSRIGAVEEAFKESAESPSIKTLIKVRMAAKVVDKSAEALNRVIKIKLSEK